MLRKAWSSLAIESTMSNSNEATVNRTASDYFNILKVADSEQTAWLEGMRLISQSRKEPQHYSNASISDKTLETL